MTKNKKSYIKSKFLNYVLPSVAAMWVYTIYTMVDGIFVARGVGKEALAAVNISMPLINVAFALRHTLCRGSQHKGFYLQRTKRREEGRQSIYSQHRYCGLRRTHCGGGSHVKPYKRGKTLRSDRRNHGICQELSGRNNHVCTVLYDVVQSRSPHQGRRFFLKGHKDEFGGGCHQYNIRRFICAGISLGVSQEPPWLQVFLRS